MYYVVHYVSFLAKHRWPSLTGVNTIEAAPVAAGGLVKQRPLHALGSLSPQPFSPKRIVKAHNANSTLPLGKLFLLCADFTLDMLKKLLYNSCELSFTEPILTLQKNMQV